MQIIKTCDLPLLGQLFLKKTLVSEIRGVGPNFGHNSYFSLFGRNKAHYA